MQFLGFYAIFANFGFWHHFCAIFGHFFVTIKQILISLPFASYISVSVLQIKIQWLTPNRL
jgi:hypothetical protein